MQGLGNLLDRSRAALLGAAAAADASLGLTGSHDGDTDNGNTNGLGSLFDTSNTAGMHFDLAQFGEPEQHGLRWVRGMEYLGLRMGDLRQVLFWLAVVAVLLLVAVMTNPTEASFRTHLTELSFRRHIAVIRSNDDQSTDPASTTFTSTPNGHPTTTTEDKTDKPPIPTITGTSTPLRSGLDTPPIAPFRFSNHVAISLRTPMLYYRTLFFLSVALTSPIGPPAFLSDPIHLHQIGRKGSVPREKHVLYLGYLGHWVQVGVVPRKLEWFWRLVTEGNREKGKKRNLAERPGVLEMKAMPGKEETPASTSKGATPLHPAKSGKSLRKSGSTNDLHETSTLPLHAPSNPSIPVPALPESRRTSIVNLLPPAATASEPADTPALIALKSDLSKAQDTLLDLKNQLLSHEQSVSDAHASLQATLDDLRNKRKEDDVDRSELKGRTKSLEEQKRQAESARKEAEKKLKSAEGLRDGLKGKIEGFIKEISDIRVQMKQSEKAVRVITEEGARFIVETRETVEHRKEELVGLEEEILEIEGESEELCGKVKEAEERFKTTIENVEATKKIGPEEEMMMMAAAYEAAAQEGYLYGQSQPQGSGPGTGQTRDTVGHGHGHGHGHHSHPPHPGPQPTGHHASANANWASQAAAYMAEAGMPLLDQNYTARSTQSSNHYTSRQSDPKRLADLTGFEDFGPGAGHLSVADKRSSGDGFSQVLGNAASRLTTTPPVKDDTSESDIYGLDPGSPNGGISTSFSANLLPQGLFRSLLGGDVTPVDDEAGSTLEEALNFDPTPISLSPTLEITEPQPQQHSVGSQDQRHHQHDSGSESGDEAEDIWRSPMMDLTHHAQTTETDPSRYPSHPATFTKPTTDRSKRFSFSRLLPPTTTPPGTSVLTPPVLSGLPALPGARRWFSGSTTTSTNPASASAENLHAYPLFHPTGSTDSLGHPASLGLGGVGGDSPFTPSEKEKEQLARKWGPLSKYRWASPSSPAREGESGGTLGRSTSLDLQYHSRGSSAPVNSSSSPVGTDMVPTASPGQSWMARHLHVNGSSPRTTSITKSKSPFIPLPNANRDSTDVMDDTELESRSLVPASGSSVLGTSAESGASHDKDKKSFKFFSLRKSGSSIWNSSDKAGTSPGSQ